MLRLVPFQNNVYENRAEHLGRQFLDTCSSTLRVCACVCEGGGGRIGAPDDLSDADTNFANFAYF